MSLIVTREHCPKLQKDLKRMEWQYLELSWMILCLSKLRSTTGSRTSQKRQAKQWRRLCSIMGGRSEVQWVVAGMAVWMHIICSLFQLLILAAADFRWQNWFWRLVRDKISRNLSDYYFGQSCKLYIYIYNYILIHAHLFIPILLYNIIYTLHFSQWPSLTPAHQQQAKTNMKSEIKPFETLPRLLFPTRDAGLWRPYLTNSCLVLN